METAWWDGQQQAHRSELLFVSQTLLQANSLHQPPHMHTHTSKLPCPNITVHTAVRRTGLQCACVARSFNAPSTYSSQLQTKYKQKSQRGPETHCTRSSVHSKASPCPTAAPSPRSALLPPWQTDTGSFTASTGTCEHPAASLWPPLQLHTRPHCTRSHQSTHTLRPRKGTHTQPSTHVHSCKDCTLRMRHAGCCMCNKLALSGKGQQLQLTVPFFRSLQCRAARV